MSKATIDTGEEVLDVDAKTGEILLSTTNEEYKQIQTTKIKVFKLLSQQDFVLINGTWEAKRDGLLKILSSLPISYSWIIKENILEENYSKIEGTLSVTNGNITRSADSLGICERVELKGNGGLHFMHARAETRALKRAIEVLFGSVINFYIVNYLVQKN